MRRLAVLAILVGLGGAVWLWRDTHTDRVESVREIDSTHYEVKILRGGWQDTGIWVAGTHGNEKRVVSIWTPSNKVKQPFLIKFADTEIPAKLVDLNKTQSVFLAQALVVPNKDENGVYIQDQAKIFIKIHPEARTQDLEVYVDLGQPVENAGIENPAGVISQLYWEGDIDSKSGWQLTGMKVRKGDVVRVEASGQIRYVNEDHADAVVGPEGTRTFKAKDMEDPKGFPVSSAGVGALIMEVGGHTYPYVTGASYTIQSDGVVQFIVNDRAGAYGDNSGSFHVVVRR
jgi:hypothetical protein